MPVGGNQKGSCFSMPLTYQCFHTKVWNKQCLLLGFFQLNGKRVKGSPKAIMEEIGPYLLNNWIEKEARLEQVACTWLLSPPMSWQVGNIQIRARLLLSTSVLISVCEPENMLRSPMYDPVRAWTAAEAIFGSVN